MKLATALRLGRVSNLPTVWTNVLCGVVLAGGPVRIDVYLGLSLSMTFAYVGGMYLNDAFDREHDARVRPERPIPSGEVSARTVLALGYSMLGACVLGVLATVLTTANAHAGAAVASALGLAAAIVAYDLHHKHNPLSPLLMGACRVLVYVTAAASTAAFPPPIALWLGALGLLSYLIGLSYAAKQENLGVVRNAWPLGFLLLPLLAAVRIHDAASALLYLALASAIAYALRLLTRKQARSIPRAVSGFIAGISLLDGLWIALSGRPALALACVLGFLLTLALQRYVPGT